ncbi:hypothetical protein ACQEVB_27880 [Pseudonocardia sp. CA-107938]|uniref:hypothetical protein n=1 Tax=Pseudonocardia sp. CA-107938 TaxID=3240021 RepID=UPI003D950100
MHSWIEDDAEVSAFLRSLDATSFDDRILVADARRVAIVERSALAAALPARRAAFAAAGAAAPRLTHAAALPLDEHHVLVTATWKAGQFDLASTYLLRRTADGLRAIAYVNHRDLKSARAADT